MSLIVFSVFFPQCVRHQNSSCQAATAQPTSHKFMGKPSVVESDSEMLSLDMTLYIENKFQSETMNKRGF